MGKGTSTVGRTDAVGVRGSSAAAGRAEVKGREIAPWPWTGRRRRVGSGCEGGRRLEGRVRPLARARARF